MPDSTSELPQFKTCNNPDCPCDNPQPVENFYRHKSRDYRPSSRCKTCNKAAVVKHRADNETQYSMYAHERYKKNKGHILKTVKHYRENNREKVREVSRNHKRRRAARLKAFPKTLTKNDWQRALDYFGGCCAVCGRPPGLWHVIVADHWISLSDPDCPGTIPSNTVPLCHAIQGGEGGCNTSKSNKKPDAWLVEEYGNSKGRQILARIQAYFNSLDTDRD